MAPQPPTQLIPLIEDLVYDLTETLLRCHQRCDEHGGNLPDLLSAALIETAVALGGSHQLIRHRVGSWEATHIQALAAGADHVLASATHDHLEERKTQ